MQQEGKDFSPPRLKRVRIGTMLRDGEGIPATAYANRLVRFRVLMAGSSKDDLGTKLQSLHRELDRVNNILKYQSDAASAPVFFRTFRSPDYRNIGDHVLENQNKALLDLEIEAEPFAYGLKETNTATVSRDPAVGGIHFEIAAADAKGDVPTPLWLRFDGTTAIKKTLLAVRRHGTPATYWRQSESMNLDIGASAADANASGGNVHEVTTDPAGAQISSWLNFPSPTGTAGANAHYRGVYRIFVRARVTAAGDYTLRRNTAISGDGDLVIITGTSFAIYDLGLISIAQGTDPIYDGYTNSVLPPDTFDLNFKADRTNGTPNLRLDYAVAIPADEELSISDWGSTVPTASYKCVYDGPNDALLVSGQAVPSVAALAAITRVGDIPLVTPNQINRYYILDNLAANLITGSNAVTWAYWPPYLSVRPAST